MKRRLCAALRTSLAGGPVRAPEGSAVIWNAFMALSRARSCGPGGPNPIAYADIHAWARLMRMPVEPHHVEILTALDEIWMQHACQRGGAPEGVKIAPRSSGQKMTPAMFDMLG